MLTRHFIKEAQPWRKISPGLILDNVRGIFVLQYAELYLLYTRFYIVCDETILFYFASFVMSLFFCNVCDVLWYYYNVLFIWCQLHILSMSCIFNLLHYFSWPYSCVHLSMSFCPIMEEHLFLVYSNVANAESVCDLTFTRPNSIIISNSYNHIGTQTCILA